MSFDDDLFLEDTIPSAIKEIDITLLRNPSAQKQTGKSEEITDVQIEGNADNIAMDDILDVAIKDKASDVHLSTNSRIALRINGNIHFVDNLPELTKEQAERIIFSIIPTDNMKETLIRTRESDFNYEHSDGTGFRVNLFYKRNNLAAVMRRIETEAFTIEELGIPHAINKLIQSRQGLILVTGPTGSGKSTSMQAMLEHINKTRVEHIITIEDPIEFIFDPKKSIISQREIGSDTLSFANSLRAALREDPDVIMIGEMRDAETMMTAMNLAETGHLVFSTLHTFNATQTVSRIAAAFPLDQQSQIFAQLSDTLIGVLSQRLAPRIDQPGRVAMFELMVVNAGVRNLIRRGEVTQIPNAIQAGGHLGMVRMEKYAEYLSLKKMVRKEDYEHFFIEE